MPAHHDDDDDDGDDEDVGRVVLDGRLELVIAGLELGRGGGRVLLAGVLVALHVLAAAGGHLQVVLLQVLVRLPVGNLVDAAALKLE